MEFKVGGVSVRFSFGFFLMIALSAIADSAGIALWVLTAVALHESGHLIAMRHCGAAVQSMEFSPFGIRLSRQGMISYRDETKIYLGGVKANMIAGFACVMLLLFTDNQAFFHGAIWDLSPFLYGPRNMQEVIRVFLLVNLFLIVYNLLPIGRLDGGVLLRLAFIRAGCWEKASVLQRGVGLLLLSPLFCAALWLLPHKNFVLLLTSIYLAFSLLGDTDDT